MSKKIFSEKEREILSRNQYVKKVSIKGITYTDEFKRAFIVRMKKESLLEKYLKNMVLI